MGGCFLCINDYEYMIYTEWVPIITWNIAKTYWSVVKSFLNFAGSTTVSVQYFVQNLKMIDNWNGCSGHTKFR